MTRRKARATARATATATEEADPYGMTTKGNAGWRWNGG
jgi:hypothetical protein